MTGEELIGPASGAVTEAAAAATLAGARHPKSRFPSPAEPGACSNCATPLKGRVCHSCGQDADSFHRPVWTLVVEALDGLFSFDGRFWRTVPPLLYRPGYVTHRYLSGVRARYVQPFRLFIVASVLFFLVFFFASGDFDGRVGVNGMSADAPTIAELEAAERELDAAAAAGGFGAQGLQIARDQIAAQRQALEAAAAEAEEDSDGLEARMAREMQQRDSQKEAMRRVLLPELYEDAPPAPEGSQQMSMTGLLWLPLQTRQTLADRFDHIADNPRAMIESMKRWAPRMAFLLAPVYALILALMHVWRRGLFFYDHLVVSLHFHAFLFFFLTLLVGAGYVIGAGWAALIFIVWSNYALYRIHRRIYGCSRFTSVLRTLVLDFVYLIVLSLATIPLAVLSLLTA